MRNLAILMLSLASVAVGASGNGFSVAAKSGKGSAPALGNAINNVKRGGDSNPLSQPKRRKLAHCNVGRKKGVRCQGRRPGSGRTHR